MWCTVRTVGTGPWLPVPTGCLPVHVVKCNVRETTQQVFYHPPTTQKYNIKIVTMPNERHRPDGRTSGGTLRPLSCEVSCLERADGSALWKSGSTQILCAVYGPIAPKFNMKEHPNKATISIIFHGRHRGYESMIGTILEGCVEVKDYPRTIIEIVLQEIQGDGSVLACAIHAAVAALLDAGIQMNQLPVATAFCFGDDGGNNGDSAIRLDPTEEEEKGMSCSLTLVNSNTAPDRLLGSYGGKASLEKLLECQEAASRASPAVVAFLRLAIEQKVTRQSQTVFATLLNN